MASDSTRSSSVAGSAPHLQHAPNAPTFISPHRKHTATVIISPLASSFAERHSSADRAGCVDSIPRNIVMPARSAAALGSARPTSLQRDSLEPDGVIFAFVQADFEFEIQALTRK